MNIEMNTGMNTEMLIGARFEQGAAEEETILNPRTGATILALPEASADQVDAAVNAAARAFLTWSRTTPAERAGYLLRLADRIAAEEQEFADLEALNCGKPRHTCLRD
jgi:aminobutyraldehyde dehydrogenase